MSFSFGAPTSAPATTGLAGGFSFGANKPATPGFGLTATSQPSTGLFGATPAASAPAFGTATPAFGATSAAPAFGATTTPAFGAGSAAPAFGATTSAFGATATPSFGTTATPGFGAATPAFRPTTTSSFGTTGLGTGGLNFGTGTNTSTLGTGLSFGAPAATTASAGLGGFGFGATTQSSGLNLFGATNTATTSSSLFGPGLGTIGGVGTQASTLVTPSLGLGGVAPTTSGAGNAIDSKSEPPKQMKLPNEISTTVESFKEFVKKQRALSSEVMRVSVKPLHTVSREAESMLRAVVSLSGEVSRARAHSRRQRAAAAAALAAAEGASRDYTTPGVELEGTAPPQYVKDLISELEQQLIAFRRQMEVADKQMQSSPKLLTEQELTLGFRRMHESLVALAGRLQAVHTQVDAQKEQYLNMRKYILKDPTNVFEAPSPTTSLDQILRDVDSNRKKLKSSAMSDVNYSSAVLSDPRTALGNIQQLAGPTPFNYPGGAFSPFPIADSSGPTWQPQPQPTLNTSLLASGLGGAGMALGGAGMTLGGAGMTLGGAGMTLGGAGGAPAADSGVGFQLQKPPGKRGKQ